MIKLKKNRNLKNKGVGHIVLRLAAFLHRKEDLDKMPTGKTVPGPSTGPGAGAGPVRRRSTPKKTGRRQFLEILEAWEGCDELVSNFLGVLYGLDIDDMTAKKITTIFNNIKARTYAEMRVRQKPTEVTYQDLAKAGINANKYKRRLKNSPNGFRSEKKNHIPDKPEEWTYEKPEDEFKEWYIYLDLCDFIKMRNLAFIEATSLITDIEIHLSGLDDIEKLPGRPHIDVYNYNEATQEIELSAYSLAFIDTNQLGDWIDLTDLPIFYSRSYNLHFVAYPQVFGTSYRLKTIKVTF